MKHHKQGKKFGLKRGPRKAFLKILLNNFVLHERLTTTEARAKEIKSRVERMISYAKRATVSDMRLLLRHLPKNAAFKLFHEIAPRYAERHGGYTRVVKLAKARKHDGSRMARVEFV